MENFLESKVKKWASELIHEVLAPYLPVLKELVADFEPPRKNKGSGKILCAVENCPNPKKAKGFCSSHYQKYLLLERTKRAARYGWTPNSAPNSLINPKLPRGHGAKKVKKAPTKKKGKG